MVLNGTGGNFVGYYVDGEGTITLEKKPSEYGAYKIGELLGDADVYSHTEHGDWYIGLKVLGISFYECNNYMSLGYSGKYYRDESDIMNDLNHLSNLPITQGDIYFRGEDDEEWKFRYDTQERKWVKHAELETRDEKMYVWVVKTDWAVNGEAGNSVAIYASEDLARKAFQEEVSAVRQNAEDRGYVIEEDNDYFESYEDGEYLLYHDTISVEKIEVVTS